MRRVWLIFSQAVTVAVAALFVVTTLKPQWLRGTSASPAPTLTEAAEPPPRASTAVSAAGPGASAAATEPVAATGGLRAAAQAAMPAVVSIAAQKAPARSAQADDAASRFFFGDRVQRNQVQIGLGSGVIVSPEGYLLTNDHVIAGADDIEVRLADGRQARARLVGTDPETDVAVLKIELGALPVISLGDASRLQVGDAVLAIGNPFNVGQTVTAGIVSALRRNRLGLSTFEDFIQTDAAINRGNSGGALVDARGALVGISTAIYSESGGSVGIGFAVPIDLAREVMTALIRDGRVIRGWVGMELRELTPEIADSLRLAVRQGVLITGVVQGGPASRAGLQPGDVVTAIGALPVSGTAELMRNVAALKPASNATLAVRRGDMTLDLVVTVGQRPTARQR